MDIKRAAHGLIISNNLNLAGTTHGTEMLYKFFRLHFVGMYVYLNLSNAGLPHVDDAIFILWEVKVTDRPRVLIVGFLLFDASYAHGQFSLSRWPVPVRLRKTPICLVVTEVVEREHEG
jgi:hypothetical protein